jgi:hypothetical protein
VSLKVLAEQLITATAVEALTAELRVIGNNPFTDLEAFDLGSDGSDNTNSLMARNQGELGNEFTLVDVQIGTADTASLDLDQNIVLTEGGQRDLDNAVDLRLLISESLHGLRKIGTHCD